MTKKITNATAPASYNNKENGLHPNTELCVTLKTLLRQDSTVQPEKLYQGTLRRDDECEEFRYDDYFTFTETAPVIRRQANPQVFNGRYVTVTRQTDGTYRPNLKPQRVGDSFDIIGYVSTVSNELLWALESLVERKYTKVNRP